MKVGLVLECAEKAIKDLRAPGLFVLFVYSFLLSVLVLAVFVGGAYYGGTLIHVSETNILANWIPLLTGAGSIVLSWFLFPLLMPIMVSFFDEYIAERIEKFDYPKVPIGKGQDFWTDFSHDVTFTVKALLLNLLALPLYFIPPFNLFIYLLLNGYLLGAQFFVMAGGRHIGKQAANELKKKHRGTIIAAGVVITMLGTIPLINLIAPFWGIALMVHLFQALRGADSSIKTLPKL